MKVYPLYLNEKTHTGRLITYCHLLNEDKHIVSSGFSIKMPKEHLNKSMGREKAFNRAIKNLQSIQNIVPKINFEKRINEFIEV
jgi:hypothetical protein